MHRYAILFLSLSTFVPRGLCDELPIKRVVLYKNGVGYFEHVGKVRDSQNVTISFTSGQLNDVLKSLTVLDLNGGRIAGVAYGSSAPVDRQLGDLRLPVGDKPGLTEILGALRGARLEIHSGTSVITGRLLSTERKTRTGGGSTLEVEYVSLLSDTGEVRTTELLPSFSVRFLEKDLTAKLGRYLDLVSSGREIQLRDMAISTEGTGVRGLFVSYISEVPVWKATYRIVLNSKAGKAPMLQGWAIIDNTVGQDWNKVELSLVAGAPQSFVQNISQPTYARRPVVELQGSMNTAPQTYESMLTLGGARIAGVITDPAGAVVPGAKVKALNNTGEVVGEGTSNASGRYELQGLPEGDTAIEVEFPGFNRQVRSGLQASTARIVQQDLRLEVGSIAETVTVTAEAPNVQTSTSDAAVSSAGSGKGLGSGTRLGRTGRAGGMGGGTAFGVSSGIGSSAVSDARAHAEVAARAQELGDLFEYKLKEPITIPKNRSALVPIIQSPITVEKVSIWNERAGFPRPQRALWLTNSSGMTLDGGTFSILEEETFSGEGLFDPIRPDEKRVIGYAVDLAMSVSSTLGTEKQRVSRVRVTRGVMFHESEIREKKTYTIRNADITPRTLIIEHPARAGYELRSETRAAETTAAWMRFRVPVAARQTTSLVVEEARQVEATYSLSSLTSEQVASFVSQRSVDKAIEDALRGILAQKSAVADLENQREARDSETEKIFDDQQRLRENLKALKGSTEEKALVQRYTQQLNQQETRLEALRKEIEDLEAKRDSAQAQLDQMIQELSFDAKV